MCHGSRISFKMSHFTCHFREIGLEFKCQKWQTSAAVESAPCAHFQKLDVGIKKFFSNFFSLGFFGRFFRVKSYNKVFLKFKRIV